MGYQEGIPAQLAGGTEWFADRFRAACGGLIVNRQIVVHTVHASGIGNPDTVFIAFYNLPQGKSIDGAQGMNNRLLFTVKGFARDGGPSPKEDAKGRPLVKVEHVSGSLGQYGASRLKLRTKTGPATDIAVYLAEFLRGVERTVSPNLERW